MILNKILFLFSKNQKIDFIIIIILGIFFSILELISVAIFLPLIALIQSGDTSQITNNFLFDFLFRNNFLENNYPQVSIFISIIIISIYLFKLIFNRYFNWKRLKFINDFTENLINVLFINFQRKKFIDYKYSSSSNLIQNIFTEANQIRNITNSIALLFTEIFTITVLVITSFIFDATITLLALGFFTITFSLWEYFSNNDLNSLGQIRKNHERERFKIFQISYSSFKEILISNKQKFFLNLFKNNNKKSTYTLFKFSYVRDNVKPLIEFITISSISILIITLFFFDDYNSLLFRLGFFAIISYKLMPSINRFVGLLQTLNFSKVSLKVIDQIKIKNYNNKEIDNYNFNEKIEFKSVKYSYPSSKIEIFNNLNLIINRGDIIGIKGESGQGKSTLIDILLGLLLPIEGKVLIDGENIIKVQNSFWSIIGTVSQNVSLIESSLRDNLTLGNTKVDDKTLIKILNDVNLSPLLSSFSGGLDHIINENSSNISGGQKQRIAIARALVSDPQILILDEATSSLDKENENNVINVISELKKKNKNLTIIIISHTEGIFKLVDKIYTIKNKTLVNEE
jgi:ATP-binding cassette, subfamily B, bacterial PglK